jgi:hypothetical protein
MTDQKILRAKILVQRLERLSADSIWAHRASGMRAALDKILSHIEAGVEYRPDDLDALVQDGFEILEKAAQEIPSPEDDLFGRRR